MKKGESGDGRGVREARIKGTILRFNPIAISSCDARAHRLNIRVAHCSSKGAPTTTPLTALFFIFKFV